MNTVLASVVFSALSSLHHAGMNEHVYITDQAQYGVADKWTPSLVGDCEDYALWAQRELRKQSLIADVWIVITETKEQHAVAVIDGYVLDIRSRKVLKRSDLNYKWIAPVEFYNKPNRALGP